MVRPSWYHVITRSAILAAALIIGLFLHYLPSFLQLDEFRPQIQELLESTFHCHAIVGNVTAELIPYPGLVVGHVVLTQPPHILASVTAVHLWLSPRTVTGRLAFRAVRFYRPRFIIYREKTSAGETHWTLLGLPGAQPSSGNHNLVNEWQVRNGSIELWDQTAAPTTKWVANQFTGSFMMNKRAGALTGQPPRLGRHAFLDIHYDGSASYPFDVHITHVELKAIQSLLNTHVEALDGMTDFSIKTRFEPDLAIQARMEPVLLPQLQGEQIVGDASFEKNHLHAHLQTGTTSPMRLELSGDIGKDRWKVQAAVMGYDAGLVRMLYDQDWVDRLEGPASLVAQIQSGPRPDSLQWSAEGKDFGFEGTSMHLPEWSAKGDAQSISVYAHGITPQGGTTDVTWEKPNGEKEALLQADVSSVTVRQVLEIFHLQSKASDAAAQRVASMNLHGYEPWLIDKGAMQARIHEGASLEIQESEFDLLGMHVNLLGTFGLTRTNAHAHVQGDLQNIPVATVVESFFKPPSPLTGLAKTNFNLDFPLSAQWINGLTGPLDNLEVDHGVLRTLKAMYRIISVLNLGNYLRLRLPQVTAQGIIFESIKGGLKFQNGVLSVDDLFLKSLNMNVDAKGSVDIPGRSLKTTLRLEMFRFLEDVLRDVPITHWIFKKPSKIFLPVVVRVEGPWDNVNVY